VRAASRAGRLKKNLAGMIKVEQTQWTHQAMRAIGSGFQSILFADLRTVEDARACVAAVRAETPGTGGRLGVGMRRDVGTVREGGSPAYVEALNEVVIAVMVEKRECVEDLDAILSVKGLDMVQFGSSDYSMSLGLTGQRNHPDVVRAERKTIETALKKGLHPRVELADIKGAAPYLEKRRWPWQTRWFFTTSTIKSASSPSIGRTSSTRSATTCSTR
jgi:2-keto-3-deoxy-L-rhamnonate aldolase RhmA